MTLLADIVATSAAVAATRSRRAKVDSIAALLLRLDGPEVPTVVAWLAGGLRQGRIGVGWAAVSSGGGPGGHEPGLTVDDVDRAFAALAGLSGSGSGAVRQQELESLFSAATPAEVDFLRRLVGGELRQGALATLVGDAVAAAAHLPPAVFRRAVMLHGDLSAAAALALDGGADALQAAALTVLRPVQPMLASTAASVPEAMAGGGARSVEWKLDGARIQAHRDGDEVRLFTRSLRDVTGHLPAVVALLQSLPVRSVVLDGEVLGVDDEERPELFQTSMSRFGRGGDTSTLGVYFFDCLHLDGRTLIDLPLNERRAALERAAGRYAVPARCTEVVEEAVMFFQDAIDAGHEGVVVKAASSTYEAGRRGKTWRKVKPVLTLDLVVLAAEWGHGRRVGRLSNIHLGARDPGGGFVMVGKTFKGMTDAMLAWQTERFSALAVAPGEHLVRVRAEQVVEVAVDGVQRSPRYPGGVSLRFARVIRYRDDKTPADADTIDDVRSLLRSS